MRKTLQVQRYQQWLLDLGIFAWIVAMFLPLIINPFAYDDAYFGPKWGWLATFTSLCLAIIMARAFLEQPLRFDNNIIFFCLILLLAWTWISVSWARSTSLAIERAGVITWITAFFWAGLQFFKRRNDPFMIAKTWILMSCILALWALFEDCLQAWLPEYTWIKPNLPDWRGWIAAGLGNTNHLGDLFAISLLLTLSFFGEARNRLSLWLFGIAAFIETAALIICYSLGSNLGLIFGAGLMIWLTLSCRGIRWFIGRRWRWLIIAGAWLFLIAFFVTDHPANPHRPGILKQGFASERWKEGGETRLAIWAQSLEMIRLHPILGVGIGNFTYHFPAMDSALLWEHPNLRAYQGLYTNAAHNEILQTLAELGIPGFLFFILILTTAFYTLLNKLTIQPWSNALIRITLAGILLAWCIHAMMNFSLQHPAGLLSLYLILLCTCLEYRTRSNHPPMPSLRTNFGPCSLSLEWVDMRRPTGIALTFRLSQKIGLILGALSILIIPNAIGLHYIHKAVAQHEYRLAKISEIKDASSVEQHLLRALYLDPNATGIRSYYSVWLLNQNRPQDVLEQIKLVRKRLNSNELWPREANALNMLGRYEEAQQCLTTWNQRQWTARIQRR